MALNNTPKVFSYETWATITTTWASETRTWLATSSTYNNAARQTASLNNTSKPTSASISVGSPFGPWIWLTYSTTVGGSSFNNTPKP